MNDIDTLNEKLENILNRLAALEAVLFGTDSDDLDEEIDEEEDFDEEDDTDEESDDQE